MLNNTQKIPEFLLKLRKLVDSPSTDKLIFWNQDGKSFTITDGHQLAKDYFPLLFKHKNIFSFIRQLNMYGFHKLNRAEIGLQTTKICYDDSEWFHPSFIRGRPELLLKIQRKMNHTFDSGDFMSSDNKSDTTSYEIGALKSAFRHLKQRDEAKSTKIADLESQNKRIREELIFFRAQMDSQSRWISEITNSFSNFSTNPESIKNTLYFNNRPLKRNILALPSSTIKHSLRPYGAVSNISDALEASRPRVKVERLDTAPHVLFPTFYSGSPSLAFDRRTEEEEEDDDVDYDDLYNPAYIEAASSGGSRTTRDYEVDELLNDS